MTCLSCEHWRREGCAQGERVYPHGGPDECPSFFREPGSDEEEAWLD